MTLTQFLNEEQKLTMNVIEEAIRVLKATKDDLIVADQDGFWLYTPNFRIHYPLKLHLDTPICFRQNILKFKKYVDYWECDDDLLLGYKTGGDSHVAEYLLEITPDYKFVIPPEEKFIDILLPKGFDVIEGQFAFDVEGNTLKVSDIELNVSLKLNQLRHFGSAKVLPTDDFLIIKFNSPLLYYHMYQDETK